MGLIRKFANRAFHLKWSDPGAANSSATHPAILLKDLDDLLRHDGERTFEVAGSSITLHLKNHHERRYAACLKLPIRYPQYDIDKLLIERFIRPGDAVLDAGANIGLVALRFLEKRASCVIAIEALPELAQRIRDLRDPRLVCIEAALSNKMGEIELTVSQSHNQGSTYDKDVIKRYAPIFGDSPVKVKVSTITIDSLPRNKFDIWKLDIEGAEIDAVRGGQRSLSEAPPRIIFAELFDGKFEGFQAVVSASHPFAYRAGIAKQDYTLTLLPPQHFADRKDSFYPMSPTYVFARSAVIS